MLCGTAIFERYRALAPMESGISLPDCAKTRRNSLQGSPTPYRRVIGRFRRLFPEPGFPRTESPSTRGGEPVTPQPLLHHLFALHAQRSPGAVAVIDGATATTAAELLARGDRLAVLLRRH